ncbi:hypothetical protein WA026_020648 [Henosepilachna vigintioctopunctata]|uniref:Uncharacterized protein n=1 Tax=Henosepilachna vigintioctopunctata TaxID=420089 RepID=A0AAW1U673_9CUCU
MDSKCELNLDNCPYVVKPKDVEYKDNFGIGYELFHSMKKYSNNIAQRNIINNHEETYATIFRMSISVAVELRKKKVTRDRIIAVSADNHSYSNIPFIAATFLGLRTVCIDGSFSVTDLTSLLNQVTPAVMFIDEEFVPAMEKAMKNSSTNFELVVFGEHDKYTTFDHFMSMGDEEENFEPIKLENTQETGLILFSSGTTGLTKGISLPHYGLLKQAHNVGIVQEISSESVVYYFTALNWMTSASLIMTCTMFGATRIISPVTRAMEAIVKYKVSHISVSPYVASLLVKSGKPLTVEENSVKSIWTTGAALNDNLRTQLMNMFPCTLIAESYGQTEASGWITMFPLSEKQLADKNPKSVGKLLPGIFAKVVQLETNKTLGANEIGELYLKCDNIRMKGYFNRDTSEEFDSDGWMKTGDLVRFNEDYCFYLEGRCKEMFKYRNFHIQPQKLEQLLESHPAVDKAIVIGKHHELDGDHPTGIVVLHKGQDIKPEILEDYVAKQVQDRQRLRGGVKIISKIPLTRTGKPIRYILKQMLERGEL